jgi:uncharacterized membrane protein
MFTHAIPSDRLFDKINEQMKTNVGSVDKVIRVIIALAIGVLIFTDVLTGTLAVVLGVFAVILVLTSLVSRCGLYYLFGVSTCKKK